LASGANFILCAEIDMELCIIGLSHRTTPLEFREQFSVAPELVPALVADLKACAGVSEVLVLSTCNRLELYSVTSGATVQPETLFESIARVKGGSSDAVDFARLEPCLYVHKNVACVNHLFRVASSLDSLVLGETEIVGQVKKAYQLAQACGGTGKTLNRLFQKALSVSKEVRTRSGIGRCSTSVGSVALDLATKIFGEDLSNRTILIVGAGKIGETTLKHLTKHGVKTILVANRSFDRALELVSRFQGEAVPMDDLPQALAKADIVVSSTSAPHYVLTPKELTPAMDRRPDRPLLLIDLAVPRDIDPAALQISAVYLYNIDQLAELAKINMERRQSEAALCERLVAENAAKVAASTLIVETTSPRQPAAPRNREYQPLVFPCPSPVLP
jgi:glutamyl-tRNA reductase